MKISHNNTFYLNRQDKEDWNVAKAGILKDSIDIKKGLSDRSKETLNILVTDLQLLLNDGDLEPETLVKFVTQFKALGLTAVHSEILLQNLILLAEHRQSFYKISTLFGSAVNTASVNNFIKGQLSKTHVSLILFSVDKHNFNNVLSCALIKYAIAGVYNDQSLCDQANYLFEQLLKVQMSDDVRKDIIELSNKNIDNESRIFKKHVDHLNDSMDSLSESMIFKLQEDKNIVRSIPKKPIGVVEPVVVFLDDGVIESSLRPDTSQDEALARALSESLNAPRAYSKASSTLPKNMIKPEYQWMKNSIITMEDFEK